MNPIEKPYNAKRCNICNCDAWVTSYYFPEFSGRGSTYADVSVVRCKKCGVRRRMPELSDDYEEEYHAPYVQQGVAIHPHQLAHFADLATAMLPRFGEKDISFLDVGCSTGRALQLARMIGMTAEGFDVSKWSAQHCADQGFKTRCAPSLIDAYAAESFDVVHCSHTIEHVPDPVRYIQEMYAILKPKGFLMLSCPNYASFERVVFGRKWGIWCLDSHLWQFTKDQVVRLLKASRFTVASSRTLHGRCPQRRWKKTLLDVVALAGFSDGLNIIASK